MKVAFQEDPRMNIPSYHEDTEHLHVGALAPHAYFIPFGSREDALSGRRSQSDRMTILNGTWHFGYYEGLPTFSSSTVTW